MHQNNFNDQCQTPLREYYSVGEHLTGECQSINQANMRRFMLKASHKYLVSNPTELEY